MEIEEIYRTIAPKLQSHLTGKGLSPATACDIVQETFFRVWKKRDELSDDPHEVSGLVFTIARNYWTDLMRKDRRMSVRADLSDEIDRQAEKRVGRTVSPGEESEETEALKRRLKASLERMPVRLLEAFVLSRIGNLAVREIAQEIDASEANVKVRVHRAKELFRELFDESDGGRRAAVAEAATEREEGFELAVLKTLLRLSAIDGEIAKEELATFRELSEEFRFRDRERFDRMWSIALKSASYLGFLSELLPPVELVREFVHESADDFIVGARAMTSEVRKRALASLTRMAEADGVYSRIERDCIAELAKRVGVL